MTRFQSRNRDACHFRAEVHQPAQHHVQSRFNLAIEMLVISGDVSSVSRKTSVSPFQSRNRDACHFRCPTSSCSSSSGLFQSRNRDACHFRSRRKDELAKAIRLCFNLAIEMLVISGSR